MIELSSLKPRLKRAYLCTESLLLKLPYGERVIEGGVMFGFFLINAYHYLEGADMAKPLERKRRGCPVKPEIRQEMKGYIDSLIAGTEERIDAMFNESARRAEGENEMLKALVDRMGTEKAGLQLEMDRMEAEYAMYRTDQGENDKRNTAAFRATEEKLEKLRARNLELENSNRILQGDKADAVRQMGEMERELKERVTIKYSFDISIPITKMSTGSSSMYPMTEKKVIYDFADWLQKANEADLPREYMNSILKLLEQGGSLTRKPRRKAFQAMLEGNPKDAMEILNSHKICLP